MFGKDTLKLLESSGENVDDLLDGFLYTSNINLFVEYVNSNEGNVLK